MEATELLNCLTLIAAISSAVEIKCSYDTAFWDVGPLYTCRGEVINPDNQKTVTEISGTHMDGRNFADVKAFTICNQKSLTTIPRGLEMIFPNLEAFRWSHGIISEIDASAFKKFSNLRVINLGDNKIVTLDYDLFHHTRKIQWIYFDNNLLEHVGHDLLTGLTDLTFVDFGMNPCIHAWADTPQEIQQINLQLPIECPLHGVEIECEYEMMYWHIGYFYTCTATVFSVNIPTAVTAINGTHMEGKFHADVKGFWISGSKTLTKIPNGIGDFFPNLKVFWWCNGNISSIDSSTFQAFPNLLQIDLGHNKIVTLDGDEFQFTRKLRYISFKYNLLEHVGKDLLTGLIDLTWADFQFNPCTKAWTAADAPNQIHELKDQLLIKCPPSAPPTTTISTTS